MRLCMMYHRPTLQKRLKPASLLLIPIIPTLVYVLALVFYPNRDWLILWPRDFGAPLSTVLIVAGAVLLYLLIALAFWRHVRTTSKLTRRDKLLLLAVFVLGGLMLQVVATLPSEPDVWAGIVRRTYAAFIGGYYTVGAPITHVADFIGRYAERAPLYPVHQARHPPGLSLIFWAGAQLFKPFPIVADAVANLMRPESCLSGLPVNVPSNVMAAGLFGLLVEVATAMLVALPLYAVVKRLAGQQAAALSVLLYPLVPGFGMWLSQFDRGLGLGLMTLIYLAERWVTERKAVFALLAGLVLSLCTFMSFGAAPMGLAAALYALVRIGQRTPRAEWGRWVRPAAIALVLAGVGTASLWLITYAAFGLNPIQLYRVVFDSHLGIDFPYWPFVLWHPWDVLTFVGLAVVAVAVGFGWRMAPHTGAPLTAAFFITLAVLSLMHVARGETGRVWIFFAPLAVGACAIALTTRPQSSPASPDPSNRYPSNRLTVVVMVMLAIQLVPQAVLMRVMTGYGIPPEQLPVAVVPDDAVKVDARFTGTGQIALLAYKMGELKPGERGQITLYWQRMSPPAEPIETAFKVFVHVAQDDRDQVRVASFDAMPMDWKYPTTCWQPHQVVQDVQPLPVNADAPAGLYPVFVGLYDPATETRPPTFASPPAQQMYGSVRLPTMAQVR